MDRIWTKMIGILRPESSKSFRQKSQHNVAAVCQCRCSQTLAANCFRANSGNHATVSQICPISLAMKWRPHCIHSPILVIPNREPFRAHRMPITFPLSHQSRSFLFSVFVRKIFLGSTAGPYQD